MTAILLALSLAQDPERLVRDLDGDDPAVREEACKELIRLGKPAMDAVRKAREGGSDEVRAAAERIFEGHVGGVARQEFEDRLPRERASKIVLKPLPCRESEIEKFFPGYRFYLATAPGEERPFGAAFLDPRNEVGRYVLGDAKETRLHREIVKAEVRVRNREEATRFGLLWLLLAYGSDELFKVESTDHQGETRY
jgi:hypothetical protein